MQRETGRTARECVSYQCVLVDDGMGVEQKKKKNPSEILCTVPCFSDLLHMKVVNMHKLQTERDVFLLCCTQT